MVNNDAFDENPDAREIRADAGEGAASASGAASAPALTRPAALHMKKPSEARPRFSPDETLVLSADDLRYLAEREAAQQAVAARDSDAFPGNAAHAALSYGADAPSADDAYPADAVGYADGVTPADDADDIAVSGPGLSGFGTRMATSDEVLDEYDSFDGLLQEDPIEAPSGRSKIALIVTLVALVLVICFEGYFLFGAKSCSPTEGGDESQSTSFLDVQPLKRDPNVDRS